MASLRVPIVVIAMAAVVGCLDSQFAGRTVTVIGHFSEVAGIGQNVTAMGGTVAGLAWINVTSRGGGGDFIIPPPGKEVNAYTVSSTGLAIDLDAKTTDVFSSASPNWNLTITGLRSGNQTVHIHLSESYCTVGCRMKWETSLAVPITVP